MLLLVVAAVMAFGAQAQATGCGAVHPGYACPAGHVVAVLNVSDQAACCAACGGYSCTTWVYGPTAAIGYPTHNCAIRDSGGSASLKPAAGHTCGVVREAPTPAPRPDAGAACNADTSCNVSAPLNWRCGTNAAAAAAGAAANCHPAGPGSKGNASCACSTPQCAAGSRPAPAQGRTQYLMIGDSISLGMQSRVFANLTARGFQSSHSPGNAASSNLGAHCVGAWVGKQRWDVISFQFGLHDIAFDVERISVEQYAKLLARVTAQLVALQRAQGTRLLWVTTTPVPTVPVYDQRACNNTAACLNPPRFDTDVRLYNAAAARVVAEANAAGANITTFDLYTPVLQRCGGRGYANCSGFQLPANVHFTSQGWDQLAAWMTQAVLAQS